MSNTDHAINVLIEYSQNIVAPRVTKNTTGVILTKARKTFKKMFK